MRLKKFMKKFLSILIVIMFLNQIFLTSIAVKAEAEWSEYTPISSKVDLDNIRNNLSGKYYLSADIVFTPEDFAQNGAFYNEGKGWTPIGIDSTPFTGTLDGNGHTISGLYCEVSSSNASVYAGLFGDNAGGTVGTNYLGTIINF